MSDLPNGWALASLEDVAKWGSGGTPSRRDPLAYGGQIPWIKTGELGPRYVMQTEESITEHGLNTSSAKIFPAGSVAVAMYGATIGKTSILGLDASTNQACAVGIPISGLTTSQYLYHFLASQKQAFIEVGKGGAQPNISQGVIKSWPIPLAPLPEQTRIADKLDAVLARVDACRDHLDRVPGILKRFRQAVLAAATSGKLTEDWRAEQGARTQPQAESGNVARDAADFHYHVTATPDSAALHPGYGAEENTWRKTNVGSLLADIRYGTAKKCHHEPQEIPVVRIPNICDGRISHVDLKYAAFDEGERKKLSLLAGDILMIRSNGSVDLVGRTALAAKADAGFLYAGYLIRLRAIHRLVNPAYLSLALSAPGARHAIELTARSTSGVNNINTDEIKALEVDLPNLAEQTEIVRRVETLFAYADRLEARYKTARAQVEKLTPALLAKAFRGELVPQDPNDEPAAALLARIRAGHGNQVANKPKHQRKGATV